MNTYYPGFYQQNLIRTIITNYCLRWLSEITLCKMQLETLVSGIVCRRNTENIRLNADELPCITLATRSNIWIDTIQFQLLDYVRVIWLNLQDKGHDTHCSVCFGSVVLTRSIIEWAVLIHLKFQANKSVRYFFCFWHKKHKIKAVVYHSKIIQCIKRLKSIEIHPNNN